MDLKEYIRQSYKRPNRKVLEGLGASEELIKYLMETPGNTNFNVIDSIANPDGGGDAEVWLVGSEYTDRNGMRWFVLSNAEDTDHMKELNTNPEDYQVYLSGEELPYLDILEEETNKTTTWADTSTPAEATSNVSITIGNDEGTITEVAYAVYRDASTAPTSVEISVKAK